LAGALGKARACKPLLQQYRQHIKEFTDSVKQAQHSHPCRRQHEHEHENKE